MQENALRFGEDVQILDPLEQTFHSFPLYSTVFIGLYTCFLSQEFISFYPDGFILEIHWLERERRVYNQMLSLDKQLESR